MATSCQLACAEACCALPCEDCSCADLEADVLVDGAVCEAQCANHGVRARSSRSLGGRHR